MKLRCQIVFKCTIKGRNKVLWLAQAERGHDSWRKVKMISRSVKVSTVRGTGSDRSTWLVLLAGQVIMTSSCRSEASLDGCETSQRSLKGSGGQDGTPPLHRRPVAVLLISCSVSHDVVNVTWFSSQTAGAAEQRRSSGPDHTNLHLLFLLLIGHAQTVRRFHWTLCHLELHPQTHSLRSAAPRLHFRF